MNGIVCAAAAPAINAVLYSGACKYAADSSVRRTLCRASAFAVLAAGTALECAVLILQRGMPAGMLVALSAAVVCAATDAATGYVFDVVTLSALSFSICASTFGHALPSSLAGAAACGGLYYVLYIVTGRRGIGLGDVKLAACIGAGLGVARGAEAAGVAFIAGGCWAAVLLMRGARRRSEMRFAPYMAAGALTCAAWSVLG